MASIWKHPESKYWTACFTDHTGKQRKKSTKTTNRKQALKMADRLESAYRRILTEGQARKLLSEAYEEIHGEKLLSATVREFFTTWLQGKEIEVSIHTWESYQNITKRFLNFLGDKANKDLVFVTVNDITLFRDHVARKLSKSSGNHNLKIIRIAFQDALRRGLIMSNPATLVQIIKVNKTNSNGRRAFTLPELKKVLENANGEWRGIILAGLYTGQRLGDLASLCWNAIDLEREEISFTTGKTGRRVILPIAPPLLNHLLSLASVDDPNAPIFPNAYQISKKQGRVSSLSRQFYEILVSAGLAPPRSHQARKSGRDGKREGNPLSFHCLRHTATSLLKNAGVSEAVAMDIIGHESKLVSANYTHIEESAKRKALNAIPDITET